MVGDHGAIRIELETGHISDHVRCFPQKVEGSYSTNITVYVNGHTLRVRGNPSRYGRQENLFGYTSLDECVQVYNTILTRLGLPSFTKTTEVKTCVCSRTGAVRNIGNGAVLKEVHVTTNFAVGEGNEVAYLKGLATQPLNQSRGCLYPNGQTVDWKSDRGNAPLVYCNAYNKSYELEKHALAKAERAGQCLGYLRRVIAYCQRLGVVRLESKIKGRKLSRENLRHYGLVSEQSLFDIHKALINLDQNLKVENLEMETIAGKLISEKIVDSTRAANTTAMYFMLWLNGQSMDTARTQVRLHRSRLRKIGIDIGRPCDIAKFSPVTVKKCQEIKVEELAIPHWYQLPKAA